MFGDRVADYGDVDRLLGRWMRCGSGTRAAACRPRPQLGYSGLSVYHILHIRLYTVQPTPSTTMPPRNNPVPNAMRLFNCAICDKGYPRQLDYENHLRSYDHNHRQRLADMKKLTASNDAEGQKPKQGVELRALDAKASGSSLAGKGFKKIGGAAGLGKGFTKIGGGFKKVGVAVGKEGEKSKDADVVVAEAVVAPVEAVVQEKLSTEEKEGDVVMEDTEEEEAITWEEYDFTKPTGCDHSTCNGCITEGIWGGAWVAV